MGTPVTNKLITRGMGPSRSTVQTAGLVVMGYGGPPQFIIAALTTPTSRRPHGRSGSRHRLERLDEVVVWAKLIEVNQKSTQTPNVQGVVRSSTLTDHQVSIVFKGVMTRIRKVQEFVKVTVSRRK